MILLRNLLVISWLGTLLLIALLSMIEIVISPGTGCTCFTPRNLHDLGRPHTRRDRLNPDFHRSSHSDMLIGVFSLLSASYMSAMLILGTEPARVRAIGPIGMTGFLISFLFLLLLLLLKLLLVLIVLGMIVISCTKLSKKAGLPGEDWVRGS